MKTTDPRYDIIGDIHGHADTQDKAPSVDDPLLKKLAGHGFEASELAELPPDVLRSLAASADSIAAERKEDGTWISSDDWDDVVGKRSSGEA